MTNISPADHNILSTSITNNISLYKNEKGSKELTATLIDNLDTLHALQQEYQHKIEEIRNIVTLYKLVTDLARKNVRNAKKWKKGTKGVSFIKANILFQSIKTENNSIDLDILHALENNAVIGL